MTTPDTLRAVFELKAAQVDEAARTIAGMLVPYGETGYTDIGPVVIRAGGLETYEQIDRLKSFSGHNRENPVGYCSAIDFAGEQEGVPGVVTTFTIASTPAGDLVLAEARDKVRDAFSVELDTLVIEEDLDAGTIEVVSGFVRGAAHVPIPAFDAARVAASRLKGQEMENLNAGTPPAGTPDAATVAPDAAPSAGPSPSPVGGAPAGLQASETPADNRPGFGSLRDLCAAIAARAGGRPLTPEMRAALTDITYSAVGSDADRGDWVGKLWEGNDYQRKVVPLVSQGSPLTSLKVSGWTWGTKPAMAAYSGDKADVPSNAVTADPYSASASRLAGAHDVDRAMVDFDNPEFWEEYYRAMSDSYAILTDAALVDALEAAATDIATPAHEGFLGAIASGVGALTTAVGADSTFVLANLTDLTTFVLATTTQDLPARLDLLGVDLDRIVYHPSVTAGHVIVGTREAATFRELGSTPIRVQAVNIAEGGIDPGVFGYYHVRINDAGGLQDVTIDTGV